MDIKTVPFKVKAVENDGDTGEGYFEGYASVFGNKDSYGDIVEPGAFTRTLEEWAGKDGSVIPVLWGHDMQDPFANIGGLVAAVEDETGLKVSGQLDLDNPTAAQVYRLMKGGRTNRMSFAYSVRDSEERDGAQHLKDLDLYEVSVVQVPANGLAEVTTVKAAAEALAKAGRTLSAKNETALREARDSIDAVLASLESDDSKASGHTDAKPVASDEEPPAGAKSSAPSEEPRVSPSAKRLAMATTITLAHSGQEGA